MKNIEVEARSFISSNELKRLRKFFDKKGKFLGEFFDETVYFKTPKDLRIRRDKKHSYLILKEGRIHDKYRKEIEIKLDKKYFNNLENLIKCLGFKVDIRWYRKKRIYNWRGIKVYLWITKGHGCVIELEKMTDERKKEEIHKKILKALRSLNIKITPRSEFEKKLSYHRKNWKRLTKFGLKTPRFPK